MGIRIPHRWGQPAEHIQMGNAGFCSTDGPKSPAAEKPPSPAPVQSWIEPLERLEKPPSRQTITVSVSAAPPPGLSPKGDPLSSAQLIKQHRQQMTASDHPSALCSPPHRLPSMGAELVAKYSPTKMQNAEEEEDEECAWSPGSKTGRQGTDLMAAKAARQARSPLRRKIAPSFGQTEEEEDEECAWSPDSSTGRQGTDLMAAKSARQANSPLRRPLGALGAPGPCQSRELGSSVSYAPASIVTSRPSYMSSDDDVNKQLLAEKQAHVASLHKQREMLQQYDQNDDNHNDGVAGDMEALNAMIGDAEADVREQEKLNGSVGAILT